MVGGKGSEEAMFFTLQGGTLPRKRSPKLGQFACLGCFRLWERCGLPPESTAWNVFVTTGSAARALKHCEHLLCAECSKESPVFTQERNRLIEFQTEHLMVDGPLEAVPGYPQVTDRRLGAEITMSNDLVRAIGSGDTGRVRSLFGIAPGGVIMDSDLLPLQQVLEGYERLDTVIGLDRTTLRWFIAPVCARLLKDGTVDIRLPDDVTHRQAAALFGISPKEFGTRVQARKREGYELLKAARYEVYDAERAEDRVMYHSAAVARALISERVCMDIEERVAALPSFDKLGTEDVQIPFVIDPTIISKN